MDSLLDKCQEPCLQQLSCNDICSGTCGECKQGRLHMPCKETCNKINPCNHTYVNILIIKMFNVLINTFMFIVVNLHVKNYVRLVILSANILVYILNVIIYVVQHVYNAW